jgi:hypothetical protein
MRYSPLAVAFVPVCRLWGQLMQRWGPPVPSLPDAAEAAALKAAATAANLASRIHQADLASRAMLSAALEHVRQVSWHVTLRSAHAHSPRRPVVTCTTRSFESAT